MKSSLKHLKTLQKISILLLSFAFFFSQSASAFCVWPAKCKKPVMEKAQEAAIETKEVVEDTTQKAAEGVVKTITPAESKYNLQLSGGVLRLPDVTNAKREGAFGDFSFSLSQKIEDGEGYYFITYLAHHFKADNQQYRTTAILGGYSRHFGPLELSIGTGTGNIKGLENDTQESLSAPLYFQAFFKQVKDGRVWGPYFSVLDADLPDGRKGGGKSIGLRFQLPL